MKYSKCKDAHLNHGCKVSLSVQEFNDVTVGFYCENPASTKKQEVDVLLFRLISLV